MKWGIAPPEGVQASWGARAIYEAPDKIELVWDRQQSDGLEADRRAILTWVDKTGLPGLKKLLRKEQLYGSEDRMIEYRKGGYVLQANPRASFGYLYLGAWTEKP